MNRDLMLAVLAMNAYDDEINDIGAARFIPDIELPSGYSTTGFFAKAFTYNGETIISYRGTDNPEGVFLGGLEESALRQTKLQMQPSSIAMSLAPIHSHTLPVLPLPAIPLVEGWRA
jgi:hypothetical protein